MTSLKDATERFLKLKKATGKAHSTQTWYSRILGLMMQSLGADSDLQSITEDAIVDYLAQLRDTHSPEGADSYTRAIKSFWTWASGRYVINDPMKAIKYPRRRQPRPMAMKEGDFKKMFDVASPREKALLAMLLASGGRASEVLQLRCSEIDWLARRQMIKGKGDKFRYLHWDTLTSDYLMAWIQSRGHKADEVFTSLQGNPLTYSGLYLALKRLASKAKIEGRFNPHSVRHLFGKMKTASGENSILISKLMGHSDVNLTARTYSQFEPIELGQLDDKKSTLKKLVKDEDN